MAYGSMPCYDHLSEITNLVLIDETTHQLFNALLHEANEHSYTQSTPMRTIDNPWQRIALHGRCLLRRPFHARLHVAGILREFSPGDFGILLFAIAMAYAATTFATTLS
jgi:hypothetical protein